MWTYPCFLLGHKLYDLPWTMSMFSREKQIHICSLPLAVFVGRFLERPPVAPLPMPEAQKLEELKAPLLPYWYRRLGAVRPTGRAKKGVPKNGESMRMLRAEGRTPFARDMFIFAVGFILIYSDRKVQRSTPHKYCQIWDRLRHSELQYRPRKPSVSFRNFQLPSK